MKTGKYIWMDGRFIKWKEAKIHVLTHSLHYGGAVYEGLRFYNTPDGPAIFRMADHYKRLFYSASALEMKLPFTQKQLMEATVALLKKDKLKSGYIRPIAYFGYGKMGLNPVGSPISVSIAAFPFGSYLGHEQVRVKTSEFIRIHPKSTIADAKITGHYSNSIVASQEIRRAGFEEALFLDYKGNVAEGPGENIFIVKKGVLYTPPTGAIIAGITRDSIIHVARDHGYRVVEKILKQKDIYSADEAFFTGTAAEITPISSLDGKRIGSGRVGEVTARLKDDYMRVVQGKNPKYKKWLTYVN